MSCRKFKIVVEILAAKTGWNWIGPVNKEFLAIEFKRTQDMRSNYAEEATKVAQKQYISLLGSLA